MTLGSKSRLSLLVAMVGLLVGCGGAANEPASAPVDRSEKVVERKPKTVEKSGPDCSDGTCIPCGDAECPKGFFCDESTSKPTCQWVPTCSQAASCTCVERALSGKCSCADRDGGAYVRCSE
jgi:hypothetical protein